MIEDIVTLISNDIATLDFIDKLGGIVKPLKIKKTGGDSVFEKVIPVCYNTNPDTCNQTKYVDYCPNTGFKSVSYFEINDVRELDSTNNYVNFEGTIRFVCWLNLPKINIATTPINNIPYEVMGAVQRKLSNSSPFVFARITSIAISKNADIFNAYTYDESENQYLMYPFDFFAIDFTVNYRVPYACISNITLNPSSC